jgi:hypothetical protein
MRNELQQHAIKKDAARRFLAAEAAASLQAGGSGE